VRTRGVFARQREGEVTLALELRGNVLDRDEEAGDPPAIEQRTDGDALLHL
jgi:hypothetical protein